MIIFTLTSQPRWSATDLPYVLIIKVRHLVPPGGGAARGLRGGEVVGPLSRFLVGVHVLRVASVTVDIKYFWL